MTLAPFVLRPPPRVADPLPRAPEAPQHGGRKHSFLSASGASCWMECPGAPAACENIPEVDSVYSAEGEAAHELAERCLTRNHNEAAFVGQTFGDFHVTAERAAGVQVYLDEVRRAFDASDIHLIEHVVTLEKLNPPTPMYGTCDAIAYSRKRRELHVIDLKYGKGVFVSAKNNAQLMFYALGAALTIGEPVSTIITTIVQPRFAGGDPVRSATLDAVTVTEWSFVLMERAHAALAPNAPRTAGTWCRFCRAKPTCPAHRLSKVEAAGREFRLADDDVAGASSSVSQSVSRRNP